MTPATLGFGFVTCGALAPGANQTCFAGDKLSLAVARKARALRTRRLTCMADVQDGSAPPSSFSASTSSTAAAASSTPVNSSQREISEMPEIVIDENITEFCTINPRTGKKQELSFREKEQLFLDAMQAYFRGETLLNNEEFDNLKEELTWQGSDVVTLNRDEFTFLDAAKSYEQGKSVLSDKEFDNLKQKLQRMGSIVAIQRGPRCSVSRRITFSDVVPDKRRTLVLFLPAGFIMALAWLSFSFELTPLRNVDPVVSLFLGAPVIYVGARLFTSLVVPNPLIVVGDCPSCGRRTHVLFGNVLNVKGYSDIAEIKCDKCKANLKVEKDTNRMILISEGN